MQETEIQQILFDIIEQAQEAEGTLFQFLRNLAQYKYCKIQRKSFKVVRKVLQNSANQIFRSYCKDVVDGSTEFAKLLAYKKLQQAVEFYDYEIETFSNMIEEYEAYLAAGYFIYALLGEPRAEEDLRDFRR